MKNLIILFAGLFFILAVPAFFGSLGFAQGGGTVRVLTNEITASSESGDAIAIGWSDIENLNVQKPMQPALPTNDGTWTYGIATAVLFAVVYFSFKYFTSLPYKNDDGDEWQPAYEKQPDGSKRKYGPE